MRAIERFWRRLLPGHFFYADELTVSARRLVTRFAAGLVAVGLGVSGAGLLSSDNWQDVAAGALLAWGVSIIAWAVSSYRSGQGEVRAELRRVAEMDLLHARLNQIASRIGTRPLNLDHEVEFVLGARMERLAHFAGLDEFRGDALTSPDGYDFWDEESLGRLPYENGHNEASP